MNLSEVFKSGFIMVDPDMNEPIEISIALIWSFLVVPIFFILYLIGLPFTIFKK